MSEQVEGLRSSTATRGPAVSGDLVGLLEERVARLVERYRDARHTIQELRGQLKERDQRIGELNDKVYSLGRLKVDARKRVERLLVELDKLERRGRVQRARAAKS